MDFLNTVELFEQNRQSVMNSENVNVFNFVIQKFRRFTIMTMVVVCEKIQSFCMRVETLLITNS